MFFQTLEYSNPEIGEQLAQAGAIKLKAYKDEQFAWLNDKKEIVATAVHQFLCIVGTTYKDGEEVRFIREDPSEPMEIPATIEMGWERARQCQPVQAPDCAFIMAKIDNSSAVFYAMYPIRWGASPPPPKIERTPFDEQCSALVHAFVLCARDIESMAGQEEYIGRVHQFQRDFEQFLTDHPSQSIGTFAAYVSRLGIPHGQALNDVIIINNLYR
ncbi:MAG: hypothetical protein OT477_22470 [Chloroflexi bacterium]|nr:hypothetical protein [Chloroflexota bacterium]